MPARPIVRAAFPHVSTKRPSFCVSAPVPEKVICEGIPRTGTHGPDKPLVDTVTVELPSARPGIAVSTGM